MNRIRVERALTLSDPGVGWIVLAGTQGAYFTTWVEAIGFAFRMAERRLAPTLTNGAGCRADLHELCEAAWCSCSCHEAAS